MRFPRLAHRSAAAHQLHSTPQQDRMNLISGKGETSSRLPAFSLFLPGSCPNNRDRHNIIWVRFIVAAAKSYSSPRRSGARVQRAARPARVVGGPRPSAAPSVSTVMTIDARTDKLLYRALRSPSADQHLDAHEQLPVRFELRKSRPHLLTHGAAVHVAKLQLCLRYRPNPSFNRIPIFGKTLRDVLPFLALDTDVAEPRAGEQTFKPSRVA
jgi:hypothetical protein